MDFRSLDWTVELWEYKRIKMVQVISIGNSQYKYYKNVDCLQFKFDARLKLSDIVEELQRTIPMSLRVNVSQ